MSLDRDTRVDYKAQLKARIGRVPDVYTMPTEDNKIIIAAVKKRRNDGKFVPPTLTYQAAMEGEEYRKQLEMGRREKNVAKNGKARK